MAKLITFPSGASKKFDDGITLQDAVSIFEDELDITLTGQECRFCGDILNGIYSQYILEDGDYVFSMPSKQNNDDDIPDETEPVVVESAIIEEDEPVTNFTMDPKVVFSKSYLENGDIDEVRNSVIQWVLDKKPGNRWLQALKPALLGLPKGLKIGDNEITPMVTDEGIKVNHPLFPGVLLARNEQETDKSLVARWNQWAK